jgi:hypothetical protein
MRKHLVLTAMGLILALLALAWMRPNTSAGASLVIVLTIMIVNAIGVLVPKRLPPIKKRRKPTGKRNRIAKPPRHEAKNDLTDSDV